MQRDRKILSRLVELKHVQVVLKVDNIYKPVEQRDTKRAERKILCFLGEKGDSLISIGMTEGRADFGIALVDDTYSFAKNYTYARDGE